MEQFLTILAVTVFTVLVVVIIFPVISVVSDFVHNRTKHNSYWASRAAYYSKLNRKTSWRFIKVTYIACSLGVFTLFAYRTFDYTNEYVSSASDGDRALGLVGTAILAFILYWPFRSLVAYILCGGMSTAEPTNDSDIR